MLLYVCLRMVSFRFEVWVTCIVFFSNGIFRSESRGRLVYKADREVMQMDFLGGKGGGGGVGLGANDRLIFSCKC